MKRIVKYILILNVGILLTTSCKEDYLSPEPNDRITEEALFNDQAGIEAHLASLYEQTAFYNFESPLSIDAEDDGASAISDEMVGQLNTSGFSLEANQYWEDGYEVLRSLNNFIEKIPESTAYSDENKKDYILGEAYFLRAYTYMELVKRYGGVPIVTEVKELPDDLTELNLKRSTEEAVYNQIISDLDNAISNLSDDTDPYRANRWVALAFKSRVMLYAASVADYSNELYSGGVYENGLLGIPQSEAENYYEGARDAALKVINNGPYELYDKKGETYQAKIENYKQLFFDESSSNKERILVEAYKYPEKTHWFDVRATPFSFRSGVGYSSKRCPTLSMVEEFEYVDNRDGSLQYGGQDLSSDEAEAILVDDIAELFENKDPRFKVNVLHPNRPWRGDTIKVRGNTIEDGEKTGEFGKDGIGIPEATPTGFYFGKWLRRDLTRPMQEGSGVDYPVIRYAEVLLNYAEACYELEERGKAREYINKIRVRAGIQEIENDITQSDIRHERLIELYGEGHRYWDLKRWRVIHEKVSNLDAFQIWPILNKDNDEYEVTKQQLPSESFRKNFQHKQYYNEIPTDIRENNSKVKQNFGY